MTKPKYPIWSIQCIETSKYRLMRKNKYKRQDPLWIVTSKRNRILKSGLCEKCGQFSFKTLQYAHVAKTSLNGCSRGLSKRYHDFLRHRCKYMLLCDECHRFIDGRVERKF